MAVSGREWRLAARAHGHATGARRTRVMSSFYERPELWGRTPEPYQVPARADLLDLVPPYVSSVLDVGCGDGFITNALPEHLDVIGVDTSHEALRHVTRPTQVASAAELPFADESFDVVLASDV